MIHMSKDAYVADLTRFTLQGSNLFWKYNHNRTDKKQKQTKTKTKKTKKKKKKMRSRREQFDSLRMKENGVPAGVLVGLLYYLILVL
jgi:hypothetical protein